MNDPKSPPEDVQPPAPLGPQQLEERTDILATPATADPQHALARGLDDHRGVAVALLDRELVEGDDLQTVEIHRSQLALQAVAIDTAPNVSITSWDTWRSPIFASFA